TSPPTAATACGSGGKIEHRCIGMLAASRWAEKEGGDGEGGLLGVLLRGRGRSRARRGRQHAKKRLYYKRAQHRSVEVSGGHEIRVLQVSAGSTAAGRRSSTPALLSTLTASGKKTWAGFRKTLSCGYSKTATVALDQYRQHSTLRNYDLTKRKMSLP